MTAGRASGLPLPSTWASAASSSGVMTAVECLVKSGPYCRQVCAGALTSEPLTGKNASVGLRATCTIEFTAAQTATSRTVATTIRTGNVVARQARIARRASRQAAAEGCARRLRVRVFRGAPREMVASGMVLLQYALQEGPLKAKPLSSVSGGENYPEPRLVADHPVVGFLCFFKRKRFGHGAHAGHRRELHRVFGIDRGTRRPPIEAGPLADQSSGVERHRRKVSAEYHQTTV